MHGLIKVITLNHHNDQVEVYSGVLICIDSTICLYFLTFFLFVVIS